MSKIKPNTKSILKHITSVMELLSNNEISVDDAKAHANLVKQANNVFKYELNRAKAIARYENIEIREIEDV